MSLVVARRKRLALYLSIVGLLVMVAAVSAVSARDPDGVWLRVGMVMLTVGLSLWLPWQALVPAGIVIWLGANGVRTQIDDVTLLNPNMMLELPGIVGLAAFAGLARKSLGDLEHENLLIGAMSDELSGIDQDTGVYEERLLRPAVEAELARSQRFTREFALILVGVDELRQRFDYRDESQWQASMVATSQLLRSTRTHVDRVYRYGLSGFALLLPESGEREVKGLIRRLRRDSRRAIPHEGEPGGPLTTHFGATFYPQAATTVDDLLKRAEVALRLAEKMPNRIQIDGAEATEAPAPETLRRAEDEEEDEAVASGLLTSTTINGSEGVLGNPEPPEYAAWWATSAEPESGAVNEPETETALVTNDAAASTVGELPTPQIEEPAAPLEAAAPEPVEPKLSLVNAMELDDATEPLIAELPPVDSAFAATTTPDDEEPIGPAAPPHLTLVSPIDEAEVAWQREVQEAEEALAREAVALESQPLVDPQPSLVAAALGMQQPALALGEEEPEAEADPDSDPPLEDAVSKLLAHLDETLDLIRTMKSAS